MRRRKINVRQVVADVKAGMDDKALKEKHNLSSGQVLKVLNELMSRGLMTPEALAARKSLAQTVYMPVFKCLSCKEIRFEKSERCPVCGGRMRILNEKKTE